MLTMVASILAQAPNLLIAFTKGPPSSGGGGGGDMMGRILGLVCGCTCFLLLFLLPLVCFMKIYAKAGQPGWAVIVPIYNYICFMRIIGKGDWEWLWWLIPVYGFIVQIIDTYALFRSFGKGTGFFIATIFFGFITIPMLAFGSSQYLGPAGGGSPAAPPAPRPGGPRPGGQPRR